MFTEQSIDDLLNGVMAGFDRSAWQEVGRVESSLTTLDQDRSLTLKAPCKATARYVKLAVEKSADVERILLGEIEIVKPGEAKRPPPAVVPPPRPMPAPLPPIPCWQRGWPASRPPSPRASPG